MERIKLERVVSIGLMIAITLFVTGITTWALVTRSQESIHQKESSQQIDLNEENQNIIQHEGTQNNEVSVPESWKVYIAPEYGFRFKYPSDWAVLSKSEVRRVLDDLYQFKPEWKVKEKHDELEKRLVILTSPKGYLSYKECYENNAPHIPAGFCYRLFVNFAVITNKSGYKDSFEPFSGQEGDIDYPVKESNGDKFSIWYERDAYATSFSEAYNPDDIDQKRKYDGLFQQIYSTFRVR